MKTLTIYVPDLFKGVEEIYVLKFKVTSEELKPMRYIRECNRPERLYGYMQLPPYIKMQISSIRQSSNDFECLYTLE